MHDENSKTAAADIKGQHHQLVEIGTATLAEQVQLVKGRTHVVAGAGRDGRPPRDILISRRFRMQLHTPVCHARDHRFGWSSPTRRAR